MTLSRSDFALFFPISFTPMSSHLLQANEREVIAVLKLLTHTTKNFPGVFFHGRAAAVLPLIGRILPFFAEPTFRSRHGVIFETVGSLLSLLRTGDRDAYRQFFIDTMLMVEEFIYLEDVLRFMLEDEALKNMSLLGGSPESEKISQSSLKNWVVNAFRERRALALTLDDTKTAVNKLHHMCEIDGIQMVVEEMNILATIFLRLDNQKIVYPNSILSTKPISNYYRSPDMGDSIDLCVYIATPIEKIAIIRQRIISYVESKKDHWYPSPLVVPMDLVGLNDLKLSVWLRHRMNHQDMSEKWLRRAFVIEEMIKIFKELDMEYRLLPLDINIRNMPPISFTCCPNHHGHYEVEHDRI
ncbi:unnamed protein product [Camellia sinensis]